MPTLRNFVYCGKTRLAACDFSIIEDPIKMIFETNIQHLDSGLSFPVIHKVGNDGIFVLLEFENKLGAAISDINFILKEYDKSKFVLKFIHLVTIFIIFSLERVQRCQLCPLCEFRENSVN